MNSLRIFLCATAVLAGAACGDGLRTSGAPPTGVGPDAILLRLPRDGGIARAYRVGGDSVLWESRGRTPSLGSLLGFDEFLGLVLAQERGGRVISVDLRLGLVDTLNEERLVGGVTSEGAGAFGLDEQGRVTRLTSVSTWNWTAPRGATDLIPLPDGSLLVMNGSASRTTIRRVIPPETTVTDSAEIPAARLFARTVAGDRLWFVTDSGLISLRARDLARVLRLALRDTVVAMVPTPSGDRVFLASSTARLRIVDRYAEEERGSIDLPRPITALRMDPDGHYLLAQVRGVDSAYVISIGTNRVVNTLATAWREDLPVVTPAGRILVVQGDDAVLLDAESGRERHRYADGSSDQWSLVRWNGFRPRAAGLDRPVEFEEYAADSAATDAALTAMIAARYSDLGMAGRAEPTPRSPSQEQSAVSASSERAAERRDELGLRGTWTVSFATMLDQDRATSMADSIEVSGRRARVVPGNRDGVPVWRVLLGPFDSREDAERAGMRSRLSYWVFEGAP